MPAWTENQTALASATHATATDRDADIDLAANDFDVVTVNVSVIFGGTPAAASRLLIELFASTDDGSVYATQSLIPGGISILAVASATIRRTIEIRDVPRCRLRLNNNTGENVTSEAIYSGRDPNA